MDSTVLEEVLRAGTIFVSIIATVVTVLLAMPTRAKLRKDIEIYKEMQTLTLTEQEAESLVRLRYSIGRQLSEHAMPVKRRLALALGASASLLALSLILIMNFVGPITGNFNIDSAIRILLALAVGTICGRLPLDLARQSLRNQEKAAREFARSEPEVVETTAFQGVEGDEANDEASDDASGESDDNNDELVVG